MNIFDACRDGNLEWLKQQRAAKKLGRAMIKNHLAASPLFPHEYAAAGGHLDVLKWLVLESGARVDLTRNHNQAVRLAVEHGHLGMVKWLVLESGQPVNVADVSNEAIKCAVGDGNLEIVKWLVQESGQTVNLTKDGGRVVSLAVVNGHFEVLKWLVECSGHQIELAEGLYAAVMSENIEICRWILERIDLSALNDRSLIRHAFMEVVGHGDQDLVERMVRRLPEELCEEINQAVELAVFAGHVHLAKWLVYESGLQIDITADNHQALRYAFENSQREMVG